MTVRGMIALVSVLGLVACETADKISTGSLSGRAVYAGQADSSGISVSAGGYSATTDAAGNYSIGNLPVGQYSVTAVAPRSTERTLAVTASVASGANTTAPTLTFTPAQVLAGQLTRLGVPLAGATVTLDAATATSTDVNGVYAFPGASGGKHTLAFSAPGAAPDRLDNVFYSPDLGAFTTDPYGVPNPSGQDALYRLAPYDLQGATRLASLNLVNPTRSLQIAPFLSPDGAFYAYGLSNDLNLTSVFVGSTAGGAPILVAGDHTGVTPSFSPNSRFITFSRRNASTGTTDLWLAELAPGPAIVRSEKVQDSISSYQFSPQTTGSQGPTMYVIFNDSTAFSGRSMREITLCTASGCGNLITGNLWQGVSSFQLSRKQNRLVFRWDGTAATPTYRLVSLAATGANATPQVVEQPGVDFAWLFHGYSFDESHWAYTLFFQNPGGTATLGTKAVPTTNVAKVIITQADALGGNFPGCVSFDPTGTRLIWQRSLASQMLARKTDATGPEVILVNFNAQYVCPVLTADGRAWIVYYDGTQYRIALANADAAAAPVILESGNDFNEMRVAPGGSVLAFTRVSGSTVDFYVRNLDAASSTKVDTAPDGGNLQAVPRNGSAVLYTKRELGVASSPNSLFWVGTSGAVPTAPVRIVQRFSQLVVNPGETHGLARYVEEPGNPLTIASFSLSTGAVKPLLRRISNFAIQDVGTPAAAKAILLRTGSLAPYRQQDGVYTADP